MEDLLHTTADFGVHSKDFSSFITKASEEEWTDFSRALDQKRKGGWTGRVFFATNTKVPVHRAGDCAPFCLTPSTVLFVHCQKCLRPSPAVAASLREYLTNKSGWFASWNVPLAVFGSSRAEVQKTVDVLREMYGFGETLEILWAVIERSQRNLIWSVFPALSLLQEMPLLDRSHQEELERFYDVDAVLDENNGELFCLWLLSWSSDEDTRRRRAALDARARQAVRTRLKTFDPDVYRKLLRLVSTPHCNMIVDTGPWFQWKLKIALDEDWTEEDMQRFTDVCAQTDDKAFPNDSKLMPLQQILFE